MKRHQAIILSAAALYFAALGIVWQVGTRNALKRSEKLIERSESDFTGAICSSVDSVLLHCYYEVCGDMKQDMRLATTERFQRYLRQFHVDEINLVDTNGVIVVSSHPRLQGGRMTDSPESAEFLCLLHGSKLFSQPFRHGTHNKEAYRKYYGAALSDRSGFIQLGMDFDRVGKSLYCLDRDVLRAWLFGRYGHFDLYDNDGDGVCDHAADNPRDGVIRRVEYDGEDAFVRPFSYCGYHYVSVLPAREYFDVRNVNFAIVAPSLALVFLFLAYFVHSLSKSAELEQRRQKELERSRARDMAMAQAIQLSALPTPGRYRKTVFSVSFAAVTHPAREVGGDFYDFNFVDSSHLAFVIADVSGKGISAAMFMMRTKNELYNALSTGRELPAAVANANARICENNETEMFVTAFVCVLDIHSGEIEYVNAGHNRPFVRRADGRVEKLMGRGGLILGEFPDADYRSDHLRLAPGDVLFLYTDGVTEAMDAAKRTFGEARLASALAECTPDPDAVLADVSACVGRFVGSAEQSDDLTGLALVWHGVPDRCSRTFAADAGSLGAAMAWLGQSLGLADRKAKARLLNAADEMMTNIVNYSGADEFTLTVENSLRRTRLTFTDAGRGYNPLSHADPDTSLPLERRPVGGLGILMTKRLVDAVHYAREDGRNILALVKLDA